MNPGAAEVPRSRRMFATDQKDRTMSSRRLNFETKQRRARFFVCRPRNETRRSVEHVYFDFLIEFLYARRQESRTETSMQL
ncbi:MAG: hypothetical protein ACHRXM_35850 [Isosphaerales bacterium]